MVSLRGLIHRLKNKNHTLSKNKQYQGKVLFSSLPKNDLDRKYKLALFKIFSPPLNCKFSFLVVLIAETGIIFKLSAEFMLSDHILYSHDLTLIEKVLILQREI